MTKNNKGNLFVFEVGPSVKFVSAIKDAIFNKKNGGKFFFLKKGKPGGGSEGSLAKDHIFSVFFFVHPSLNSFLPTLVSYKKIWPIYDFVRFSVTKKEQN